MTELNITEIPDVLAYQGRRNLNQIADQLFYEVEALTKTERESINRWFIPEGGLFVIGPSGSSPEEIKPFTYSQLVSDPSLQADATVLVVAGVGSSALGTAGLARSVSNALGKKVMGLVSGYGLANILSEAMGGYFAFHMHNNVNAALDRLKALHQHQWGMFGFGHDVSQASAAVSRENIGQRPDSRALLELLHDPQVELTHLVGHSKGNFMIADALRSFHHKCSSSTAPQTARFCTSPQLSKSRTSMRVITLGCVVEIPEIFDNVTQVMGKVDALGKMNSSRHIYYHEINGKAHSLNKQQAIMLPLDAVETIRNAAGLPGTSAIAHFSTASTNTHPVVRQKSAALGWTFKLSH